MGRPVTTTAAAGTGALAGFAGLALMLVSASQRTPLAGVPPLIPDIQSATGLSETGIGLLNTLPIVAMGLLAPPAALLGRRLGADAGLLVGLILIAAGSVIRLVEPVTATLMVGAVVCGAGITVIGTLLPGVIVARFPGGIGRWTGLTTLALALGATVAASVAVPLASSLGGWRASLAFWAVPAILALVAWLPYARGGQPRSGEQDPHAPMPFRSQTAWIAAGFTAVGTAAFFSALAWVAPTFTETGISTAEAGLLLGLFTFANMAGGFLGPVASDRWFDRRTVLVVSTVLSVLGLLGLAGVAAGAIPGGSIATLGALSAAATGLGLGGCFGSSLAMVAHLAGDAVASRGLAAMVFLVSYLASAPFPTILGALAASTGSFAAGWVLCAVLMALTVPLALSLGHGRDRTVGIAAP